MELSEASGFEIYDAHHHLWDLSAVNYPWLSAPKGTKRFFGDPTDIQKNYLVEDLADDIGDLPVTHSVHIQVGAADDQHLAETAWVQQQIDSPSPSLPAAMVAYADLESADIEEQLDRIQTFSGVRGIRQIVGRAPDEDAKTGSGRLLQDNGWLEGLRLLSRRGMSFDLQLIPSQMQGVYEIFKQVDELPVVLCHCGSPWFINEQYSSSQSFDIWKEGIAGLASLPNVHCKVSGLSMFNQHWQPDKVAEIFQVVIDAFGVERVMFGSNFPVDKLHVDYQTIWQTYFQLASHLSLGEKKKLFRENCRTFYRL